MGTFGSLLSTLIWVSLVQSAADEALDPSSPASDFASDPIESSGAGTSPEAPAPETGLTPQPEPSSDPTWMDPDSEAVDESLVMTPPPEPAPAMVAAPPPRGAPTDSDFVHAGGFIRPMVGFSMCTRTICNEIPVGFGGALIGGYRFPYVGVGAAVFGGGGRTSKASSFSGLDGAGSSYLFAGGLAQFVPIQSGRFSPTFDVALGYFRLLEYGRVDGQNAFALYSRAAVAVGGSLDIFVSSRVSLGPSFHYLFPFGGQQCNEIFEDATGRITDAPRQCSDFNYREDGLDAADRRSRRRDTTRAWLASIGVTVHLGSGAR